MLLVVSWLAYTEQAATAAVFELQGKIWRWLVVLLLFKILWNYFKAD